MDLHVVLGMLVFSSIAVNASDVSDYIPKLANISYSISDSTFALEQPNCIFNAYPTTNVWLVIARNEIHSILNDTHFGTPVSYSLNGVNDYYHTLLVSAGKYPCSTSTSIKVINVGSGSCTENKYCNGKLNNNQTYRARFVLLNSNGIFDKTQWSNNIPLKQGLNFTNISTWPSGRSGGMIVLVSILSVLLAILLVVVIVGRDKICWKRNMFTEKHTASMDSIPHSSYRKHYDHLYLVP